jgi:hypothetical protein
MNHGVDGSASVIGVLVERCALANTALASIFIDPELGELLGLPDGRRLPNGSRPTVLWEVGLGREIRFEKKSGAEGLL